MKNLIYAVDDEEALRELYSCAVNNSEFECETFANADELFAALTKRLPDLILLDVMLDGMSGFEILDELKLNARTADVAVVMVSAKGDEVSKVKGLNGGADDYVSKPFGVMELTARIRANLRKRKQNTLTAFKDVCVDDAKHQASVNGEALTLTLKEYNLLKELVQNALNVVARDDLLNRVWGYDYSGETRTLDIHVASIRKILASAHSNAEIVTVRGVGYLLK